MGLDIGGAATLTAASGALSVNGASNWMNVNANGILTRPQTPYMRGQLAGGGLPNPYNAGGGPLLVTADVNVGSCWNNATGLYTCPVPGYYMAVAGNIAGGGPSSGYFYLRKNGVDIHFTHWNHSGSWHYVSLSAVVACAANDYMSWHVTSPNPSSAGVYSGGNHCMYSIALMA